MSVAWFIVPYGRKISGTTKRTMRYCAMDDHTATIVGEGGYWSEAECAGDKAVVKVRASDETIAMLEKQDGYIRVEHPDTPLDAKGKGDMAQLALDVGFAQAEIQEKVSDKTGATVKDALDLVTTRRVKPRWDEATQDIVFDGPEVACPRTIENLDTDVRDT